MLGINNKQGLKQRTMFSCDLSLQKICRVVGASSSIHTRRVQAIEARKTHPCPARFVCSRYPLYMTLILFVFTVLALGCSAPPPSADSDAAHDETPTVTHTRETNSVNDTKALSDYNVLLIVLDSLRADHLGCYGYHRPTSPFVDTLAESGIVFERAQSNSSYTGESISSLFSGRFPSSYAWGTGWHARPNPDQKTMAEHFREAGYATGLFANTTGLDYPGFSAGFDAFEFHGDFGQSGRAPYLVDAVIQFTKEHLDSQRFVYMHFLDPHSPYEPPESYYERFAEDPLPPEKRVRIWQDLRINLPGLVADGFGPGEARYECMVSRYDAEIAFVDAHLKILFNELNDLGVLDNTLVIFTSDHGEEFLDHDFVEHAWRLYWESVHVPLIFWAPGILAPERIQDRVSLVDVMPTLLHLSGMSGADDTFDGVPLFEQQDDQWRFVPHDNPIIAELALQSRVIARMIQHDGHAYLAAQRWLNMEESTEVWANEIDIRQNFAMNRVAPRDIFGPITYEAFYNTDEDPTQHNNLIDEASDEQLRPYRDIYKRHIERCPTPLTDRERVLSEKPHMPPEQVERMRALGYLHDTSEAPGELPPEMIEHMQTLGYL